MKEKLLLLTLALAVVSLGARALAAAGTASACVLAGASDAPITIEEYSDLDCSYCKKGAATMSRILRNYAGKVKLVFRNMPLPSHQPNALVAAKAVTAVCRQSGTLAYRFQQTLFENQDQLLKEGEPFLYEAADQLGVDVPLMKSDMKGEAVAASLAEDERQARQHAVQATPTYLVGPEKVVGAVPYEEISEIIDRLLEKR